MGKIFNSSNSTYSRLLIVDECLKIVVKINFLFYHNRSGFSGAVVYKSVKKTIAQK